MSIFANETEMTGMMVGPGVDVPSTDGDGAFGKPVSFARRQAAMDHMKSMGGKDTAANMAVVDRAAEMIARDRPHDAMQAIHNGGWNITAVYRILAVLCCA